MAKRKKTTAKRGRQTAAKKQGIGRQGVAIILFAVAVFLLCVALISSNSPVWMAIHDFYLGLFGVVGYVLPVLVGAAAVLLAMDKPTAGKITVSVLLMAAVSTLLHVFLYGVDFAVPFGQGWATSIAEGYSGQLSGVFGALLGYVFEYLFDDLAAKIVLFLLFRKKIMEGVSRGGTKG